MLPLFARVASPRRFERVLLRLGVKQEASALHPGPDAQGSGQDSSGTPGPRTGPARRLRASVDAGPYMFSADAVGSGAVASRECSLRPHTTEPSRYADRAARGPHNGARDLVLLRCAVLTRVLAGVRASPGLRAGTSPMRRSGSRWKTRAQAYVPHARSHFYFSGPAAERSVPPRASTPSALAAAVASYRSDERMSCGCRSWRAVPFHADRPASSASVEQRHDACTSGCDPARSPDPLEWPGVCRFRPGTLRRSLR
jgi:hypothetical protein